MICDSWTIHEDWFSRGKEDAWSGRPKCPPEQDPEAATHMIWGTAKVLLNTRPAIHCAISGILILPNTFNQEIL